jgi:hypothetical protein
MASHYDAKKKYYRHGESTFSVSTIYGNIGRKRRLLKNA